MSRWSSPPVRMIAAVLCAAAAVWSWSAARQERALDRAQNSLDGGRAQLAETQARAVSGSWMLARAARLQARAALALGDLRRAEELVTRASRAAPSDWSLHRDRAVLLLRLGSRGPARTAMGRALRLNPQLVLPAGFTVSKTEHP